MGAWFRFRRSHFGREQFYFSSFAAERCRDLRTSKLRVGPMDFRVASHRLSWQTKWSCSRGIVAISNAFPGCDSKIGRHSPKCRVCSGASDDKLYADILPDIYCIRWACVAEKWPKYRKPTGRWKYLAWVTFETHTRARDAVIFSARNCLSPSNLGVKRVRSEIVQKTGLGSRPLNTSARRLPYSN